MTRPSVPTTQPFAEAYVLGASMAANSNEELDHLGRLRAESEGNFVVAMIKRHIARDESFRNLLMSLVPPRTVYVTDTSRMQIVVAERRQRSLRTFAIVGMLIGLVAALLLLWNGFDAGTINISDATTSTQHAVSSLVDTTWFAIFLAIVFTIVGGLGGALVGVLVRDPMTKLDAHMTYCNDENVYHPVLVRYSNRNN